jgi:streptogramin lyase
MLKEEMIMSHKSRARFLFAVSLAAAWGALGPMPYAQAQSPAPSSAYQSVEHWAKLPEGRPWGAAAAISMDSKGNVWVFERCGANSCADSTEAPILEFDSAGKLLKSFGAGMFIFPHSILVDKDDNIWVTDADGKNGKGQQSVKFSPEGKVLMTLGKAGVAGDGPDTFNRPVAVVIAPNGDIFVADGHGGGTSNARIVKFSKDGKFIKAWGKRGAGPGEFNGLHGIAMDQQGRIFVADRGNDRIQIFNQDGDFIAQWTQFSRPSAIYIDKQDRVFVSDSTSMNERYPQWERGIRIGSAKDGIVTQFIPDVDQDPKQQGGAEGLVLDARGNIYASETNRKMVKEYIRQ